MKNLSRAALPVELPPSPAPERRAPSRATDPERKRGFASAVKGIFGLADEPEELTDAERRQQLYAKIGAFLERHLLDPTPLAYDFAYQYVVGVNHKLILAADEAIERDKVLRPETIELIVNETRTDLTAEALNALVDQAQAGIERVTGLVRQSGAEAKAYGQAIESRAAGLGGGDPTTTIQALVGLTQTMIQKTRDAEAQLRESGKQMTTLRGSLAEARRVAESDALTGLANRRAFDARLKQAVLTARASGAPLSLAFCDIDHFKNINDTHGHEVGDRIIKFVAKLLATASNNNCHVARHGGEEFVMLFEGMGPERAAEVVDACREDLAGRRLIAKESSEPIGRVTFSAGVAGMAPGSSGRDLLSRADNALYRAKREGRDRVIVAES